MATYLIGEETIAAIGGPQARMPGLSDYRDNPFTLTPVECAFDIDVRRWQRRGLLIPETTFQALWQTDGAGTASDGRSASLKVRVVSADELGLIYRARMPRQAPLAGYVPTNRGRLAPLQIRRSTPLASVSSLPQEDGGSVSGRRQCVLVLVPTMRQA